MATDTLFKAAGVSITNGVVKLHVSRDTKNKEMWVVMDGESRFVHKVLPHAMTKPEAFKFLTTLEGTIFQAPEVIEAVKVATSEKAAPVAKPKVPKVVNKPAPVAATPNPSQISAGDKASRRELIRQLAARRQV